MPFQSKAQMKAAFAGGLGPEMKAKASEWAHETPDAAHLPAHKAAHQHALKGLKAAKPGAK